jgi:hypothetical protein
LAEAGVAIDKLLVERSQVNDVAIERSVTRILRERLQMFSVLTDWNEKDASGWNVTKRSGDFGRRHPGRDKSADRQEPETAARKLTVKGLSR